MTDIQSQNNLMLSKRFAPLFWTQFFSAFNDNFLKNSLIFLILFQLSSEQAPSLITIATLVLIAPFLLFSALGGQIADKYDKAIMAERLKLAEIGAAIIAVIGIAFASITILMVALFLFGLVSALFGPIKYGILPDHMEKHELPKANAWVEAGTFLAILGGTIVGGIAAIGGVSVLTFGPMMMGFAILCWLFSRYIPRTGSADPDLKIDTNIVRSTAKLVGELRADSKIWRTSLMVSWFWLVGAIALSLMPPMVKDLLGGNEMAVTLFLAVFAITIGLGSAAAAWFAHGRIALLPAPIGTLLVAIFAMDLSITIWNMPTQPTASSLDEFFQNDGTIRVGIDLAGLAFFGAFLVVPTFAAVQTWAPETNRARIIAAVNVINALFIVSGGAVVAAFQASGATLWQLFAGLAVANIFAAVLMLIYLPTNLLRDATALLFRLFFRVEVKGLENLDKAGQAPIITPNHVSYLDGALMFAITEKAPVFAIDETMAQKWWVKPFLKCARFMPIDTANPMATRTLINEVNDGQSIVIFPEGRLTTTSRMMKIYDGPGLIACKTGSMIVPVRIDGLEKTFFTRLTSNLIRRRLFPKVKVTILPPQKLKSDPDWGSAERRRDLGRQMHNVMSDMIYQTTETDVTIIEKLLKVSKQFGKSKPALEDPITGKLNHGRLQTGISVLGRKLLKVLPDDETNIGVMLPNANGAAVTVLGLMSAGKVPAMINFTAGITNIISACKTAQLKTILSSRAFIEQAELEHIVSEAEQHVKFIWLDELRGQITPLEKITGLIKRGKPIAKRNADDPAVILFTSGSEGTPKGVVLTHRNVLSNVAQVEAQVDFNAADKLFNVLPMFHSFGLTAGTILPLVTGASVYLYPSPLHYRIIPELIYNSNATIIFGTDTFLTGYAKTANQYDMQSLRYCFAGAEPVKAATRQIYLEKFGVRIFEGYGVTESAPVLAVNAPMFSKSGTVGKLLTGIEHRLEPVDGIDHGGRLFVKGENIMAGYLKADNPGIVEPLEDGWHDTGDIVTIDEDGFVTITGRAKRFAKIGGEMVSLAAIEAIAAELWPEQLTAVAAIKDARKGEKLVMITEQEGATRSEFLKFAKSKKVSDLIIPSTVRVGEVPILGSGKVDFVGLQKAAES